MPIPNSYFLKLLAFWPTEDNFGWDLSKPSPWQGINIALSPAPLQPIIYLKFSHAINSAVYSNNSNISNYLFLTSQTHPAAQNITNFTNVSWNANEFILSLQPSTNLVAGDIYSAFLSDKLPDAAGRLLDRSYAWTFEIDGASYSGPPEPVLFSPNDQTVITNDYPVLQWGVPKTYSVPSGSSLYFNINIYTNKELTNSLWGTSVSASSVSSGSIVDPLNYTYSISPAVLGNLLQNNTLYWWSLKSLVVDSSGNAIATSDLAEPFEFFVEAQPTGPDSQTYPLLSQSPEILSPLPFYVSGVTPQPGYVHMVQPQNPQFQSNNGFPQIAVIFSEAPDPGILTNGTLSVQFSSLLDYNPKLPVNGTWSISNNILAIPHQQPGGAGTAIIFTPSDFIIQNTRYSVTVNNLARSSTGDYLQNGEPSIFNFLSYLTPFYSDPYAVRQAIKGYNERVSDEDLYYAIWQASMQANREALRYFPVVYPGGPSVSQVINFTYNRTYALDKFVEVDATIRLLEQLLVDTLDSIGRKEMFKESEVTVDSDRAHSIKEAIRHKREEWRMYMKEISLKAARPRSVIKSSSYLPAPWRDKSFQHIQRKGF